MVATGQLNDNREFVASEVLAKHDEQYMPPEVSEALERSAARAREEGREMPEY